jgi:putative ABC transport system permease protein
MVVALIVAVVYAALGLVAGLTIVLATRSRDLNVLRTLGLSRRGLGWTLLLEQIPIVLVAMIGGSLLGVGLAVLVGPSLGLGALADDLPSLPIVLEPLTTLAVGVLPTGIGVLAALVAGWLLRRTDLARAVRFNEG